MAVSAIGIKELYYGDVITDVTNLDGTQAHIIALKTAMTQITNVHQDTWQLEESEPSQDSYKNQLTKSVYRMGDKEMGDITIQFSVGQYDYQTKKDLLGGEVIKDASENVIGWKRARGISDVKKSFLAVTEDYQVVVFPKCNVLSYEGNTDGAISINMSATVLEPEAGETAETSVHSEYWFDATPSA